MFGGQGSNTRSLNYLRTSTRKYLHAHTVPDTVGYWSCLKPLRKNTVFKKKKKKGTVIKMNNVKTFLQKVL